MRAVDSRVVTHPFTNTYPNSGGVGGATARWLDLGVSERSRGGGGGVVADVATLGQPEQRQVEGRGSHQPPAWQCWHWHHSQVSCDAARNQLNQGECHYLKCTEHHC
jgi:hypothetical protein